MDFSDDDDEKEQVCFYTPKFGYNSIYSIEFDDHSIMGSNYLIYKPDKIIFWTSELGIITGIQTWFRNMIDNNFIHSGENKGSNSMYKHIFNINTKEYLIKFRIWKEKEYINKIYLETNQGNSFEIGINGGFEIPIESLKYGNKIIISFFGNYKNNLESIGLHLIDKKDYMRVMFIGYFELKKILKNEKKRENYLNKINKKEFGFEEEAIIRACMLPNNQFNAIMKYCVF